MAHDSDVSITVETIRRRIQLKDRFKHLLTVMVGSGCGPKLEQEIADLKATYSTDELMRAVRTLIT